MSMEDFPLAEVQFGTAAMLLWMIFLAPESPGLSAAIEAFALVISSAAIGGVLDNWVGRIEGAIEELQEDEEEDDSK